MDQLEQSGEESAVKDGGAARHSAISEALHPLGIFLEEGAVVEFFGGRQAPGELVHAFEKFSRSRSLALAVEHYRWVWGEVEALVSRVGLTGLLFRDDDVYPVEVSRSRGAVRIEGINCVLPEFTPGQAVELVLLARDQEGRYQDTVGRKTKRPYAWFFRYVTRHTRTYGHVMAASVLIGLIAVLGSFFTMNVYDRVVPNNAFNTLWVLAVGVLVAYSFDFALKVIRGLSVDWAGKEIDLSVSSFLYERLINIRFSEKPASTGVMANHMRDFDSVRDFFTSLSLLLLIDMPFLGLYLLVIWYIGGPIVLVPLVAIPVILVFLWGIQHPLRRAIEASSESSAQKQGLLIESLNGMVDLKLLNALPFVSRLWDKTAKESSDFSNRARFWSSLGVNFSGFVQQVVQVVLVITGVYLIAGQSLTMGGLIACSILNGRVMAPLGQLVSLAVRVQQTMQSLDTLTGVVGKQVDREEGRLYVRPNQIEKEIRLDSVDFAYGEDAPLAIKSVSLTIKEGEKVAIVGSSGGGKSTLVNLMAGIHQPCAGAVYIGDRDLRQIDPLVYRKSLCVVPQHPFLMSGSVRQNLMLANAAATDEQMLEVSRVSMLDAFVSQNPSGYDMQIGEGGGLLSGGQRQSLAIARAMLGGGELVIMDEPTSAMDSKTESEFKRQFAEWAAEKTVVLVTHKLSMLDIVDRVIVIEQGALVTSGDKASIIRAANR